MVYSRWFEEANWKIFRPVVLGDQPYLMGEQATRIDAAACGLLANILLVPLDVLEAQVDAWIAAQ